MNGIFVTGTDTGIGKTVVTGLLAKYLKGRGFKIITQKWIETGSRGQSSDIKLHQKISGIGRSEVKDYSPDLCPYVFKFPASPHLSARLEHKKISVDKIKKSFKRLAKHFDFVIVEGTGGALVPLNKSRLLLDLAKDLKLPALIVAPNKLGAINQALLTIEALKSRRIRISGLIFNDCPGEDAVILKDNPDIVKKISKQNIIGSLPRRNNYRSLYKKFSSIAGKITL